MEFNLYEYQGKFYEVYRQNAYFEGICDINTFGRPSNVTADYIYVNNNKLDVINKCYDKNGNPIVITGTAIKSPNLAPNQLLLTLNVGNRKIQSIYTVFYTDYANYSIVGNLENNYLSFLSRTNTIDLATLNLLSNIAILHGFKLQTN